MRYLAALLLPLLIAGCSSTPVTSSIPTSPSTTMTAAPMPESATSAPPLTEPTPDGALPSALTAVLTADPAIAPAISDRAFVVSSTTVDGVEWMLVDAATDGEGLLVLVRVQTRPEIVDAAGFGVGCGVAPGPVLTALGLACE